MIEETNSIKLLLTKGEYNHAKDICMKVVNSGSTSIEILELLIKCKIKLNEDCKELYEKVLNYYFKKNNFEKALKIFNDYLVLFPRFEKRFYILGSIHSGLGNLDIAKDFFKSGIKENISTSDCFFGLGLIEEKSGNEENALKYYEKSNKINESANYLNQIGKIHMNSFKNQDYKKAEIFFNNAMTIDPEYIKASINNGILMQKQFRFQDAFKSFIFPFFKNNEYRLDNKNKNFNILAPYIMLSLNNMVFNNHELSKNHIRIFEFVLKHGNFNSDLIVNIFNTIILRYITELANNGVVNNFIIEKHGFKNYNFNIDDIDTKNFYKNKKLISFLQSEVTIKYLKSLIVTELTAEKFFTSIRSFYLKEIIHNLEDFEKNVALHPFLSALCNQSFKNEYCWFESKNETKNLENLNKIIIKKIKKNINISDHEIQILSSYANLNEYDLNIKEIKKNKLNSDTKEIIKQQVDNIIQEKEILKNIPSISKIKNNTSKKVSKQYQDFPYPRWDHSFDSEEYKYINNIENSILPNKLPLAFLRNKQKVDNLLIAGCGTGRHPIQIAYGDKIIKIDAIDLSLSSLAYGVRKAEELGITNINWLHGDILDLNKIKTRYDAIECCGVLHHMENPKDGFDILDQKLKPGGLMKIALYSRSFRNLLKPSKKLLAQLKTKRVPSDIRFARNEIINKNNNNYRIVKILPDFYTTSEFIDLLMHERELDFNIRDLKDLYEKKYEFLGFSHTNKNIHILQNRYKSRFSDDPKMLNLDNWSKLEQDDPTIFGSMYQFFLYKK